MIRRFYILPLDHGVSDENAQDLARSFSDADLFIDGLWESASGVDLDSRTVIWEHNFIDEETYAGPYMVHPYHCQTLDHFLLPDSPGRISHDFFTARYTIPKDSKRLGKGIRRVLLLHIEEGSDLSSLENFDAEGAGMAMSVFSPENVAWVSVKGRSCTHIWDQGFADMTALERFLMSPVGLETSSREGLRRMGVNVERLQIFTYPFELKDRQVPAELSKASPIFYSMTAQLDPKDVDTFVALLEQDYDPFLAEHGTKLVHRWRGVEGSSALLDVQSVWQLESFDVFSQWRIPLNLRDNHFLREAMSLAKGGSRRFYR